MVRGHELPRRRLVDRRWRRGRNHRRRLDRRRRGRGDRCVARSHGGVATHGGVAVPRGAGGSGGTLDDHGVVRRLTGNRRCRPRANLAVLEDEGHPPSSDLDHLLLRAKDLPLLVAKRLQFLDRHLGASLDGRHHLGVGVEDNDLGRLALERHPEPEGARRGGGQHVAARVLRDLADADDGHLGDHLLADPDAHEDHALVVQVPARGRESRPHAHHNGPEAPGGSGADIGLRVLGGPLDDDRLTLEEGATAGAEDAAVPVAAVIVGRDRLSDRADHQLLLEPADNRTVDRPDSELGAEPLGDAIRHEIVDPAADGRSIGATRTAMILMRRGHRR